ncbi:hypothetical protein M3M44_09290, partial [Lactobacillus johnsonii]|nr:hypothetical protein [Lactobacillus johnsonii]
MLKEHRQSAQKYSIDNNEEYYEQEKSFGELRKITLKDEEKNWSNYLVEQKESSIIKSTVLE